MLNDVKHSDGIKEMLFFIFASPIKTCRHKLSKSEKAIQIKNLNTFAIKLTIFLLLFLLSQVAIAQENKSTTLPTPKGKDLLFFLQRTPDVNTVIYELNYKADGTIDCKAPVKGSWLRYAEGGDYKNLSSFEKKFAYGVKCKAIGNGAFEIRLAAYQKIVLYLLKSKEDQQYKMYIKDEGKNLLLKRVFVKINGGSFWFPKVVYIDLFTVNSDTGIEILKRINLG